VQLQYNYDGFQWWTQKNGAGAVYHGAVGASGGAYNLVDPASTGYPRDNTYYRFIVQPRNAANGWTGRQQGTPWALKLPNPMVFIPSDCNTWWSNPIPGKWRTNPQADDWFYQGKSTSGNSVGSLFYGTALYDYFTYNRLGYIPTCTGMNIHVKRAWTGGLVAAVAVQMWTHSEINDGDNAFPTLVEGPFIGASYARNQQAWQPLPASWFNQMRAGAARGICFYVSPSDPQNQLRPEIGNVSNVYMILDKPSYGTHLEGYPPGTLRIYHDG
jgi:hypothetical protein